MSEGKRLASFIIWVSPDDCMPPHGLDMQRERDANKVKMLADAFWANGFDKNEPALVGYPLDGKIQLLTGTHRHEAAKLAGILLPIKMWLRSDVEEMWGTELWDTVIKDIPVNELECAEVKEGRFRSPYDPVDPSLWSKE